jgi:hypothetical protein
MSKPNIVLLSFDSLTLSTVPSYTIKGLMPETGVGIVWGPKAVGKSFGIFDMVMHVALGWRYRGRRVRQGAAVYCAFEGEIGFVKRIEGFRRQHAKRLGNDRIPFYLQPVRMRLVKDHKALIAAIKAKAKKVRVVVLDTLNRSLEGSENNSEDMSAYFDAADAIREEFDCVVIIIHHCGVNGERPRGHTSLTCNAEFQYSVKRDKNANCVLEVEYMKDGPQGDFFAWTLERVTLGKDDEGDDITSCIVEPILDYESAPKEGRPNKSENVAFGAFRKACGDSDATTGLRWATQALRMKMSLRTFQRAKKSLIKSGKVLFDKDDMTYSEPSGEEAKTTKRHK